MGYRNLMVQIDLNRPNDTRIKIAAMLAEGCGAGVTGVAACPELPLTYSDGYAANALIERERNAIAGRLASAEAHFRRILDGQAKFVEWRGAIAEPVDYLIEQSRAADLVILGTPQRETSFDAARDVDPADFVAASGRPLLLVPDEIEALAAKRILIAWKDTREARRAVFDALPMLHLCESAIVAEIDDDGGDLTVAQSAVNDVAVWLGRHGIKARGLVAPLLLDTVAQQLGALAFEEGADLIIAGAYGHSRIHEWILGGVSRECLMRLPHCIFLSH